MPPVTEWVDPYGLRVRILAGRWPERWRGTAFALAVAWNLFKERRNYQIAYFLMHGLHVVTGVPVAALLGKPIVMKYSCSSLVAQMNHSWAGRAQLRFLRRWASRILILNPGMVEEAKAAGLDLARVSWMPNPVDTGKFRPPSLEERIRLRQELNLPPDSPVALFVGRLDPQKELPWLLAAFARVAAERPRAILALVGEGSLRVQLTQLVERLDLKRNVIMTGRLDADGVLKWLQASDIFTLVSAVEGLPLVVIEAMSTALPTLLSDIPAHTQLVDHEVHGLLTETGNLEAIARGLVRLIDDPALRARLGAAARQRMLEQYATSKVVDCYEALFESLLVQQNG